MVAAKMDLRGQYEVSKLLCTQGGIMYVVKTGPKVRTTEEIVCARLFTTPRFALDGTALVMITMLHLDFFK